jgi:hypothetical protein
MKEHFMDNTSTSAKTPIWLKLCLWTGLACIGQFFVVALIGVIRGYSVQSYVPLYVMLGGSVLVPIGYVRRCIVLGEELSKMTWRQIPGFIWMFYLAIFFPGLVSIVGIMQSRYAKQGEEFYKLKNYSAAITLYQKEVDTWYLRLKYNLNEDRSLFGIARSYCQLENFEQARQTYQRLFEMSRGYYQERSQEELTELNKELGNIAEYEKQLVQATNDNQKANILFDIANSYRSIYCDKKTKEQYALIQTLNIEESRKEQAAKFAVNLL